MLTGILIVTNILIMDNVIFRKGQPVTLFSDWDRKGSVRVANLTVHSCGKKQMILVDESGAKFEGSNFLPSVGQYPSQRISETERFHFAEVHPRMSDEDAESYALHLGAKFVEKHRADMEELIKGSSGDTGYIQAMRKKIAELHEPRVIRYQRGQ